MKNEKVFVIDIGGTSIKTALCDESGSLSNEESFPTPKSFDEIFSQLRTIYDNFANKEEIIALSFSCPGAVDYANKFINGITAVPCIVGVNWQEQYDKYFDLPFKMDNDANCAALGENWQGNAKDKSNILLYVIGTGVGGGIIIDNKVYRSKNNFAGEFGYQHISSSGLNISDECAAPILEAYYHLVSREVKPAKEILDSYDNNPFAKKACDYWFTNNAKALTNLTYTFDPDEIVIAGGITQNENFLPLLEKYISEYIEKNNYPIKPKVIISKFKNNANLIGAAALFFFKK